MVSKPFRLRHFCIHHDIATHKVGTDAVLLGSWANIREDDKTLLDIGTGCGIIALMLAQRSSTDARIDAVEISAPDARQARENVARSPWPDKISVHETPVQEFVPKKQYDLITTNPPFFTNSLLPPDDKRRRARHTNDLPFKDLLVSTSRLLAPGGRIALILPPAEATQFTALAENFRLLPIRKTAFRSRAHKPAERMLLELAYQGEREPDAEVVLYGEGNTWSAGYRQLTRDFYLDGGGDKKQDKNT